MPVKLKVVFLAGLFFLLPILLFAQSTPVPATTEEQQLENNTENNTDIENEDDSYAQEMQYYSKHPVNLNSADEDALGELKILSSLQIKNLLLYRGLLGRFINVYEIQAIPGWDIQLIRRIKPFVFVDDGVNMATTMLMRLHGGEHNILVRVSQTPERSKGYLPAPATAPQIDTKGYLGSPQKILFRYKYQYKNLLQYGILGEKDAGEQFFKGRQKQGFDFYSAHFFARDIGIIKSLAVGDFAVNLGQGLIQWQSLAFKKSVAVLNIKRETPVLRPYNAAGEINFHRGAGLTLAKNKWAATAFVSYRKLDGNLVKDTSASYEDYISSLQTSGYHRTASEVDDKGVQKQLTIGGNISFKNKNLHVGLNMVGYKFKLPLFKSGDPYNKYALSGSSLGNYSIDGSYTYKNMHLFGEAATTKNFNKAFVGGALISASKDVDISFLYRNISKGYQSLYANAFTENSYPNNETGFYSGVSVHQGSVWQWAAYADFYRFPWLKYTVDAPSNGAAYLLQLTCSPNKKVELYSCLRNEATLINAASNQPGLSQAITQHKKTWRTHLTCNINPELLLNCRFDLLWLNTQNSTPERGFLIYENLVYKPLSKPWSSVFRIQYFETNSYNSRMYAYENDVLYSFAIPVFYDKGFRYYTIINYDVNKKLSFWLKWAQTIYTNKTLIGSGLDEIKGSKKSDIRVQMMYKF
jgi:hypothetical protein